MVLVGRGDMHLLGLDSEDVGVVLFSCLSWDGCYDGRFGLLPSFGVGFGLRNEVLDGVLAVFPQILGFVLEGHSSIVGGFYLPSVCYVLMGGGGADLGSRVVVVGV